MASPIPSYVQDAAAALVQAFADAVKTPAARALAAQASSVVFTPSALAQGVRTAVREITRLEDLENLATSGLSDLPPVPTTTINRRRQAKNQAAFVALVRRAATIELARRVPRETFTDRTRAAAVRDQVSDLIDDQQTTAGTAHYQSLRALRAAVSTHIQSILPTLPRVVRTTPATVLPSLVLAYEIYGEIEQAGNIADRNRLARPGFVPAHPVELTTEV